MGRHALFLIPAFCAAGAPASAARVEAGIAISVIVPDSCRIEARTAKPQVSIDVACGALRADPSAGLPDEGQAVAKPGGPAPSVTIEELAVTPSTGTREASGTWLLATIIF